MRKRWVCLILFIFLSSPYVYSFIDGLAMLMLHGHELGMDDLWELSERYRVNLAPQGGRDPDCGFGGHGESFGRNPDLRYERGGQGDSNFPVIPIITICRKKAEIP